MKKISFVIPCYNSEKTIESVINEIKNTMNSRKEYTYEVVLVNDNSKDNVWQVIKKLVENNSNIIGINFCKNFGQHSALMAGYRNITGDIIVSLDDDGQTPVDEVFSLIDKLNEGYDVVYASYPKKKHSWYRNIGTRLNNFMCESLLEKPKELMITSFYVAQRFIIDEMIRYENPFVYVSGLVLRTSKNIASVPVNHRARETGESGYSFKKLLALWINGFTAFSVKPLRISMLMGVSLSILGFIYFIWIFINKMLNPSVPIGWTSTISIVIILGGMILFVLGMIGEYIGRIYISINNSPQYVIKEIIKTEDESKGGKDGQNSKAE